MTVSHQDPLVPKGTGKDSTLHNDKEKDDHVTVTKHSGRNQEGVKHAAIGAQLEAVANHIRELDRRYQRMDDALQILRQRVTGHDNELHMVEKHVRDESKGSSFGILQESIQHLTEDSLTSQTKLRNLSSLLESIDGRVLVIEERVVQQQMTDNSTITEVQRLRQSLERRNESSFQQLRDLNTKVSQLQQQAIDVQSKFDTLQVNVKANHSEKITVTFDDLPSQSINLPIENGYKGITWTNVYYVDPVRCGWSSCYRSGVVSSPNIVYNGYGDLAKIAPINGSNKISLFGFFATACSSDGMLVVKGYKNGNVVATKTVTLHTTSPTKIDFDSTFQNVEKFTFVGSGRNSDNERVVLDDITLAVIKI